MSSPIDVPQAVYQRLAECANRAGCLDVGELLERLGGDNALLDMIANELYTPPSNDGDPQIGAEIIVPTRPSSRPISNSMIRMVIEGTAVSLIYHSHSDEYKTICRAFGFEWQKERLNRRTRQLDTAMTAMHCAAEVGHRLVKAGFIIVPPSTAVANLIIEGNYIKERRKWVKIVETKGNYNGWFSLHWMRDEDLYVEAKQIESSRYDDTNHCVVVPLDQYEQVADFAELHGFCWSDAAVAAFIKAGRTAHLSLTLTEPTKESTPPMAKDSHTDGILDELKDPTF